MVEELKDIKNDIQEYVDVKVKLIKLHTAENISRILSQAATFAVVGYLMFFILLFFSFAVGFFLAERFHSNELGFLAVAGIYLILLILFLVVRKHIIEKPIIKAVIKLFFPKFSNDEKE